MVVAVNIDVKGIDRTSRLFQRLPQALQEDVGNGLFEYAQKSVVPSMRKELMQTNRPITQDRLRASSLIRAKKISKFRSHVLMPLSLKFLDSAKPHWVSIRRGRKIHSWVSRNYGNYVSSGMSRVFRGPRGGVRGGFIWFTPDPFVTEALTRSRRMLPRILSNSVRKAFRRSRR